jgi:hypothetical protein
MAMDSNQREPYCGEDEIDLYELWLVLRKRLRLIAGIFLLSVTAAVIVVVVMPPVYEVSALVPLPMGSNRVVTKTADGEIAGLLPLVSAAEVKELLSRASTPLVSAGGKSLPESALLSSQMKPVKDQPNTLQLVVRSSDATLAPEFLLAVLRRLNDSPSVQQRLNQERKGLLQLQGLIAKDLVTAERTRQRVLAGIDRGSLGFNPLAMDETIRDLRMKQSSVDAQLQGTFGFTALVTPAVPTAPVQPKKMLIITLVGVTALFAGIFVAFFLEWLEKARQRG